MGNAKIFSGQAIDVIKTHENIFSQITKKPVLRNSFGNEIVELTEQVVGTHFDWDSAKGTKACLAHLIGTVTYNRSFLGVTFSRPRMFACGVGHSERKAVQLIADSLILTTVAYRYQLNEHHTNLASIRKHELNNGFEWLCYWASCSIELSPERVSAIALLDVTKAIEWVK